MFQILKWIFIIFVFLNYPLTSIALPEDNKAKVYIISDRSNYNYKTGINTFEGNVKIDQGTTHLTADKLITKTDDQHKIKEAIAYGLEKPAHYWTLPKIDDPELHTHSLIIKYYPLDSKVIFEKNVVATQGENSFQGQLILYNMRDEIITVPASDSGRAVLVYNPDSKK